jgi:DNA-binding transcriptional ArsR family regulator
MSDEWKDELKKLKEEIASLKEQLRESMARKERKHRGIYIDIGNRVHDYVEGVMESVMEGISGEIEKSILIGPRGTIRVVHRKHRGVELEDVEVDPTLAASAMSALGNEHRLKILRELTSGGKYISELQEKLSEIASSTLSSHLDVLEEAGLVVQEKVRGRYLITIPGRMAYQMANQIAKLLKKGAP